MTSTVLSTVLPATSLVLVRSTTGNNGRGRQTTLGDSFTRTSFDGFVCFNGKKQNTITSASAPLILGLKFVFWFMIGKVKIIPSFSFPVLREETGLHWTEYPFSGPRSDRTLPFTQRGSGTGRALLEEKDARLLLFRFYFLNGIEKPALDQPCLHKNTI